MLWKQPDRGTGWINYSISTLWDTTAIKKEWERSLCTEVVRSLG